MGGFSKKGSAKGGSKGQGKLGKSSTSISVIKTDFKEGKDSKGKGLKGKGKGKKGSKDGEIQEKRIDPSDNNGPFTKQSFIKYHGEELGNSLWEQAGELLGVGNSPVAPPPRKTSKGVSANNPFSTSKGESKGSADSKGAGGKGAKPGSKGKDGGDSKGSLKGKGKKGSGKKGKDANGEPQEKRVDPSDGNGPFTYASFVKYHGPELGQNLWEQAGALLEA